MKWWNEEKLLKELAEYFNKWQLTTFPCRDMVNSASVFHRDNLKDILGKYKDA